MDTPEAIHVTSSASTFPPVKQRRLGVIVAGVCAGLCIVLTTGYFIASRSPVQQAQQKSSDSPITPLPAVTAQENSVLPVVAPAPSEPQLQAATLDPVLAVGTAASAPVAAPVAESAPAATVIQPTSPLPLASPRPAAVVQPPANVTSTAAPDAVALAELIKQVTALTQRVESLTEANKALHAQLDAKKTRPAVSSVGVGDQQTAAPATVTRPASVRRNTPVRRVVQQAVKVVPAVQVTAPAPAAEERVIGVDMWDNKPSVVLRTADGKIRFASQGDSTEAGRISSIQAGTQSVTIEKSDGSRQTIHVQELR